MDKVNIGDFSKSRLYQHMVFKPIDADFSACLKQRIMNSLDDETFDFARDCADFQALKG